MASPESGASVADVQAGYKVIDRQIGLLGGTVLLVGTVVGISVFLLPGALISEAGPSIILALAITAVPMIFAVLMLLQLGGAMPVAGGAYVYASRLVGPFWGFLIIWLVIPGIWTTLLFTATGFAEFTRFFVDVPAGLLMAGVLVAFLLLNLRGITLVAWVQLVMVAAIVLGFLAFILPGAAQVDTANYSPLFPAGVAPFLIAIVSLYIPFQGFGMIIELGEELKDPIKNIPRVLVIGMGLAVLLSLALVTVFSGLDGWETLGALEGGIAAAAAEYLPAWVGGAVAGAAILGALTTLNAVITSYSRTLMRASRDGVISARLAAIHPVTKVPHWSIVVLSLPPILLVPVSPDAVTLSVLLALIILFAGFVSALALWNLPKRFPECYENSIYKLPMPVLKIAAIGSAVSSVLFWLIVLLQDPRLVVVLAGLAVAGYVYYRYQVHSHSRRGVTLREHLGDLAAHEAVIAGVAPTPAAAAVGAVPSPGGPVTAAAAGAASASAGLAPSEESQDMTNPDGQGRLPLLQVSGLEVGYGQLPVLYGLDFEIEEGETAVVLGLNGAGKTTTVSALAGVMRPWGGSIVYDGEDVTNLDVEGMVARGVVMVPEGRRVFSNLPVEENLRVGAWVRRNDKDFVDSQIRRCYGYFPRLEERRDQIAGTLSGGEQQMLAISRGLMANPRLLMIDEASLGLAPVIVKDVLNVVREINDDGVTVILNEQNVGSLRLADKAFVIQKGVLVYGGSAEELRGSKELRSEVLGVG